MEFGTFKEFNKVPSNSIADEKERAHMHSMQVSYLMQHSSTATHIFLQEHLKMWHSDYPVLGPVVY